MPLEGEGSKSWCPTARRISELNTGSVVQAGSVCTQPTSCGSSADADRKAADDQIEAWGGAHRRSPCCYGGTQSAAYGNDGVCTEGAPRLDRERGTSAAVAEVPPAPAFAASSEPPENLDGRGTIEHSARQPPRPESHLALARDRDGAHFLRCGDRRRDLVVACSS